MNAKMPHLFIVDRSLKPTSVRRLDRILRNMNMMVVGIKKLVVPYSQDLEDDTIQSVKRFVDFDTQTAAVVEVEASWVGVLSGIERVIVLEVVENQCVDYVGDKVLVLEGLSDDEVKEMLMNCVDGYFDE